MKPRETMSPGQEEAYNQARQTMWDDAVKEAKQIDQEEGRGLLKGLVNPAKKRTRPMDVLHEQALDEDRALEIAEWRKNNPQVPNAKADGSWARLVSGSREEDFEFEGQREVRRGNVLPAKMDPDAKEKLEAAGVRFIKMLPGDDQFWQVELPKGWIVVPLKTNPEYWSEILDAEGRQQAKIFFKNTTYERKSFLDLP